MSDSQPTNFKPPFATAGGASPALPLDYSTQTDQHAVLRAIAWLALAVYGVDLIDIILHIVILVALGPVGSGALRSLSFAPVVVKAPFLIWLCIAAVSVARGRFRAVHSLFWGSCVFGGLSVVVGLGFVLYGALNDGRFGWMAVVAASSVLSVLLHAAFPTAVAILVSPYRKQYLG